MNDGKLKQNFDGKRHCHLFRAGELQQLAALTAKWKDLKVSKLEKKNEKNNSRARFARAVFIFGRDITCFAVEWTTIADDDKVPISLLISEALIPISFQDSQNTICKRNDVK